MVDLSAVVEHYKTTFRERAIAELDSFRTEPTLDEAIARAALAEMPDGRRYPHQRRLKRETLVAATKRLLRDAARLGGASNFAKLHDAIASAVAHFGGIGELYLYDTALRIGARLEKLPTTVYLHAGARRGAAALGLHIKGVRSLFKFDLPEPLRVLEPHEIEDVLCIYKRYFAKQVELGDELACWDDDEEEEESV